MRQQRALCWSSLRVGLEAECETATCITLVKPKSRARGRVCDSNVHYAGQALRVGLEAECETATCIMLVKPKSRARGRMCDSNVHYAGQA